MRELLFRGKRLDSGEWAEGAYKEAKVGKYLAAAFITETLTDGVYETHRVDPETVGQFTGLKDNSKRIFEGDIVRHHNGNPYADSDNIELGKVYWDEKYCGWRRTSNGAFHHGCVDTYRMSPDCVYEVIGNIHDNPELLGGA